METALDPGVTFSALQTAEAVGCTYRQLDYWVRCGHVRPAREASGSGSRRRFTRRDVRAVRLVFHLRRLGAPMDAIAGASAALQDATTQWTGPILVTDRGDVLDLAEVMVGLHRGVTGWVVDLTMWDE